MPKIALVTTTIQVPRALSLLRAYDASVRFFVAFDQNTPEEAVNFCVHDVGNTYPIFLQDQEQYKCSALIGWNCIQRRNIATLEALKWGADVLVFWDTDNYPFNPSCFHRFAQVLEHPQTGLCATGRWFNPGLLVEPAVRHRGFPITEDQHALTLDFAIDAQVGVSAGIIAGDPDISAVDRIATAPQVHSPRELARSNLLVKSGTWTVFNSQWTAFRRELAPALFLPPGVGRYDDIYASLICQRVMRERNLHVHIGCPIAWQERNPHNLVTDLRAEIDGMANVLTCTSWLDAIQLVGKSVLDDARRIWDSVGFMPYETREAALAYLDDCAEVLG